MNLPRQIKITTAISWVSLTVCFLVYLYISLTAWNTVIIGGKQDYEQNIREIKAMSDIHSLQERAAIMVQMGHASGSLSMFLCRLALGALLVAMTCSVVILVQTRKLGKKLAAGNDAGQKPGAS